MMMRSATAVSPFVQGFRALLPIWFGAVPIAFAYAITARTAGLSSGETLLMSLTVFSAGTQLSAVSLLHAGAPAVALIFTAVVLNVHQVLLGFSLGQRIRFTWLQRWVAAFFLNDGAYGVSITSHTPSFSFLLGAELSMFVVWNGATALGSVVGQALPDPAQLGVDFMFPLLFLALLIPMIRSRADLAAVGCAGGTALLAGRVLPSSLAVLMAALVTSAVSTWWTRADDMAARTVTVEEQP